MRNQKMISHNRHFSVAKHRNICAFRFEFRDHFSRISGQNTSGNWDLGYIHIWTKPLFVGAQVRIYDIKPAKKKLPKMLWLWGLSEFGSIAAVLNWSHLLVYRFLVHAKSKNDFAQSLLFSGKTSEYFRVSIRTLRSFFTHFRGKYVGKFGLRLYSYLRETPICRYTSVYIWYKNLHNETIKCSLCATTITKKGLPIVCPYNETFKAHNETIKW